MIPTNLFSAIDIGSYLTSQLLWSVFLAALAIFIILAAILFYHWNRYSYKALKILIAEIIFILGSLTFLAGAVISLNLY